MNQLGGSWSLVSVTSASTGGVPADVRQVAATAKFTGDSVSFFDGCNHGSGTVHESGGTFSINDLAVTAMGCKGDPALDHVQLAMTTVLVGFKAARAGDHLSLTTGSNRLEFAR